MEESNQLYTSGSISPQQEDPFVLEYEPVWKLKGREKSLAPGRNRTTISLSSSL
jgi:hypothetical protein